MSSPGLICEIDFIDDPLTPTTPSGGDPSPTWEDVSEYLRGEIHIHRGRNHERGVVEAGTATLTLLNTDRRFDPEDASGPYFPDVLPMRKIRIGASWDAVTYWLWNGYVESWDCEYQGGNKAFVHLECVDAFKFFNLMRVTGGLAEQGTDERIVDVLDTIGWPEGDRDLAVGDVAVIEDVYDNRTSALSLFQAVAATEIGMFFMSANGAVTFQNRDYRDGLSTSETFSNDPASADYRYTDLRLRYDDSNLWNQIYVSRMGTNARDQVAANTGSRDAYFTRSLELSGLLYIDDTEANAAADYYLHRYKDPRTRADRITIDPAVGDSWPDVLERELSDIVTVERATLLDADVLALEAHIESIDIRIKKEQWAVTWQLSPVIPGSPAASGVDTVSDWTAPTLAGTWANTALETPAGYHREGNWVYLRGSIDSANSGDIAFVLPVGYRPGVRQRIATVALGNPGSLRIDTNGDVRVSDNQGAGNPVLGYVNLNGGFRIR